jgi:anti-sigma factor RsiW
MKPDETTLALWLDDELTGSDLASVEAWAATQPEQLAAREEIRRWREMVTSNMAASVEPPYPDFFNSRVLQSIREQAPVPTPPEKKPFFWKSWLMPIAACAGMAFTFWAGMKTQSVPEIDVTGAPRAIPVDPVVYTPENGVNAEWFTSSEASATVIVLNGINAIPDSMDFSETVYVPMDREIDSTAGGGDHQIIDATY